MQGIIDDFMAEHLTCPTTPEAWKELEREFRLRWNVPHALVDAEYRFRWVDIGTEGSCSDAQIYWCCAMTGC